MARYELRSAKRKYEWDKKHDDELGRKKLDSSNEVKDYLGDWSKRIVRL